MSAVRGNVGLTEDRSRKELGKRLKNPVQVLVVVDNMQIVCG